MKTADIALIVPPFDFTAINTNSGKKTRQAGYYLYYPPIGLCSIAAVLRNAGIAAVIIDGQADAGDADGVIRLVKESGARMAAVSVTTPALPVALKIISGIKKEIGIPVGIGGPHVSCDPKIVDSIGVDFGVVGDGEYPMAKIAGEVLSGRPVPEDVDGIVLPGISKNTGPENIEPAMAELETLPFPARDLLNSTKNYFNPFVPTTTTVLLTARGCPHRCSFCCRTPSMGAYRPLSVERAIAEMEVVAAEGYGFVSILDETFTFDRERAIEIARSIRKKGFKFLWSCQTRADRVDAELMRELRNGGCINISFGVEAGAPEVRAGLEKKISDSVFADAFRACRSAGVSINAFIMIGNPDETAAQIERSIEFAIELSPDYAVFNLGTLLPGSLEYENRIASGELKREIWDDYMFGRGELPVLSRTLERAELSDCLRRAFKRFYLRPGYVMRRMAAVRSPRDMALLFRQARTVVSDYVAF